MNPCNGLILELYQHPKVNELLQKINPPELRGDLMQELAIVLLDYDCDRLQQMESQGTLLSFTRRVLWKMATLPNGDFWRTYRRGETVEFPEDDGLFLHPEADEIPDPDEEIKKIDYLIEQKMTADANEAHEAMIFQKWSEMLSCDKVAIFFGIPRLHVVRVVKKVKNEMKKNLK